MLKSLTHIFIICALAILWSCTTKPSVVTDPDIGDGPEQIYSQAERLYQSESYIRALSIYQKYVSSYPEGPFAAAALMKIGSIHTQEGDYESARRSFERVIEDYSDSPFIQDARIALLNVDYLDGAYETVVQRASELLEELKAEEAVAQIYLILGETYMAMGSPEDAIFFYTMALREVDVEMTPAVSAKFQEAAAQLDAFSLEDLLVQVQEPLPRSYLMFRLGQAYGDEGRYDEGIRVLTEFIDTYPDHENIELAYELIDSLAERMDYARTTVGVLLPLSGRYEIYGRRALKGIEFALGQLLTRKDAPIHLIVKDTGSDSDQAAAAAQELVEERVAAIIGPIVTAEIAAEIANDNAIPIITFTQKEKITDLGDFVFRNFLTPQMQVKTIVGYATEKLGLTDFAILYPEERYGRTFMDLFWDEVLNQGGRIVGLESYNPSHTDFADPIKKLVGIYYEIPEDLREEEPEPETTEEEMEQTGRKEEEEPEAIVDFEAVFIPDSPNKAGLIIPQLAFYDVENVYLLGTNLWHSPKLIDMAQDFVQGAIMTDAFFTDSRSRRVRRFVSEFEGIYGEKPGFIEATTYDSTRIIFDLILREDIRSRNSLKRELQDLSNFPGVTGVTSFNEKGEAQKNVSLLRVEGDRFLELDR